MSPRPPPLSLGELLQLLDGGRRSGSGHVARCPSHEDRTQSLSISEGDDGRILLHCHAGCGFEQIVTALHLEKRNFFPAGESGSKPRIVTAYKYTDETGATLYEVVRYEPKDFRQRRPDGKGGHIWNMKDARRVLYRLPSVVAAVKARATIWVVEGEKDADNLAELGLIATTAVMGAGKWRPEYSEQLRGARRVVIIPDKDEPGRKHADQVAGALAGVVPDVRMLELPGPGKDVSDWLAAGGTRDELEHLAELALATIVTERAREPRPGQADADSENEPHLTDQGNARCFALRHFARVRFVRGLGPLVWDGNRWKPDDTGEVMRLAREIPASMYARASELLERAHSEVRSDDRQQLSRRAALYTDHGRKTEAAARLQAMVFLAQSEPELVCCIKDLDHDPWLMNCLNGTVDLRTGILREHRHKEMLTKLASVNFDSKATSPLWTSFLERVHPDPEVRAYLARLAGYWLTGVIREHVLPIHYGSGRNGKSVFHNVLRRTLGDYAKQVPVELLMAKQHETHPTERMVLLGCRLAIASELDEGRALNVPLVKTMTGGEPISARRMREDFIEFEATHKLSLNSNHRPRIRETKDAIWERVHLITWTVKIPDRERDLELEHKLQREASGILGWAVRGCLEWQRLGLSPPDSVRTATEMYRAEEDPLAAFLGNAAY